MNEDFLAAMHRAAASTRALNLAEATRVIQDALAGPPAFGTHGTADPDITPPPSNGRSKPFPIDPDADVIEPTKEPNDEIVEGGRGAATSQRMRKPLGEVLRILREGRPASSALGSVSCPSMPDTARRGPSPAVTVGAQFPTRSFTGAAGRRNYKLYIPASAHGQPRGLVVMLHGCKQDPDGFAAGTRMNDIAETRGLLVAYPGQTGVDNASSCWNWFRPTDQMRGAGEPAIIAGITAELMSEFNLDRGRVFVAGLSAGGAMAAVLGETYPDLYAATGIHSGLPYGSANDVMSAFSVMRGDAGFMSRPEHRVGPLHLVRTIVFQGSADRTVHPSNAKRIVTAATPSGSTTQTQTGRSAGGRTYTRTIVADPKGLPTAEHWLVEGAGHAWSGGHGNGSYTDPSGPDASAEMVRFFLEGL